jgi:glycogen debranching enzyme/glycosyltransferase involved in cell wall biosynthesis
MKIAQIAPLMESCPPRFYGGTERIVHFLTEELVRQGHEVTLFASGDSRTSARLVPCCEQALRLNPAVRDALPHHVLMLELVRRSAAEFDVLHFHIDFLHYPLATTFASKMLTTLHGRLDFSDLKPVYSAFPHLPLISISNDQRRPMPPVNWRGTVHHGLPRDLLPFVSHPKGDYLAFLGRISPEKRPDRAIAIAAETGMKLKIAAKIDRADQAYWHDCIRPLVANHTNVEFVGEITEQNKAEFLGNARALLFPIDWPEPFGLVMIEAMACGTPVIAYDSGSVREVVDHGRTGFIVRDLPEAIAAVHLIEQLPRAEIRAGFETRFTAERMALDYLAIYRGLLDPTFGHPDATITGQRHWLAGVAQFEETAMQKSNADVVGHELPNQGEPQSQFSIPAAASLTERRPRTLKHDDTFAVFDRNGDAIAGSGSPEGLFHRDTRYLSHLYLSVEGQRPLLLSSTLRDDNATLSCDLTNPDLFDASGQLVWEHDLLHIRRSRFLWNGACRERLAVRNFDDRSRRVRIAIDFASDFADLFEVRGMLRQRRGQMQLPLVATDRVVLSYVGLDHRRRSTSLRFDPVPDALTETRAVFTIDLQPQQVWTLGLEIACNDAASVRPPRHAFLRDLCDAKRAQRLASSRAASITTSNNIFNEALRRSVADLYMLVTQTPEGPYPYAGIPWFSAAFGRDALITALQTLWLDPGLTRGVLLHLAANQANAFDPSSDAEPGKILHEVRYGEMAELREVPFRRYYGSVDSTPLFVLLAGAYLERTGDLLVLRRLWPNIEAALVWIDQHGDCDGDGFVEYSRKTGEGLVNQGWKDSHDSVFHANGVSANGPIALAEVQAYVYGAWKAAAAIAGVLGHAEKAATLAQRAQVLRSKFDAAFFDEALGSYVLALDGEKRPCRVRTSNAGHALLTGIAFPERGEVLVKTLMGRALFSGWGIRTLGAGEARYNPMSYHNGSVWPHDNALIAAGLARYGYKREAARIFEGLFAAATYIDMRRLPELFCGFPRQRSQGPVFYPVACSPQAWAAAAPLFMLQSCLGLSFDPQRLQVSFDEPVLPEFLNEVNLLNLAFDGASADVSLRRSRKQVVVDVVGRHGPTKVVTRG